MGNEWPKNDFNPHSQFSILKEGFALGENKALVPTLTLLSSARRPMAYCQPPLLYSSMLSELIMKVSMG